jgi:hypothetical protein
MKMWTCLDTHGSGCRNISSPAELAQQLLQPVALLLLVLLLAACCALLCCC